MRQYHRHSAHYIITHHSFLPSKTAQPTTISIHHPQPTVFPNYNYSQHSSSSPTMSTSLSPYEDEIYQFLNSLPIHHQGFANPRCPSCSTQYPGANSQDDSCTPLRLPCGHIMCKTCVCLMIYNRTDTYNLCPFCDAVLFRPAPAGTEFQKDMVAFHFLPNFGKRNFEHDWEALCRSAGGNGTAQ